MKYITKILACLPLTMMAFTAQASSYRGNGEGEYHLGVDLQYLFVQPQVQYKPFLKQQEPGADLYIGYRLNKLFGLEMGYASTTKVAKRSSFAVNQTAFNAWQVDTATDTTGKIRYKNTHFDLNGYLPLGKHIDGIVSVGVGFMRPRVTMSLSDPSANLNSEIANIAGKTNAMVRFGVGLEGMLGDYWGLRSMVRYENTSRVSVRNAGIGGSKILKDGVSVAVGFYRYLD